MILAGIIFIVSLFGIAGLFGLKYWEEKHHKMLANEFRARGDERAMQLKDFFEQRLREADKFPPTIVRFTRWSIHELALAFAALARTLEHQAHRLADLVSHKHRFVQRESKNEFLKQMGEYPSRNLRSASSNGVGKNGLPGQGNGNGVDTSR